VRAANPFVADQRGERAAHILPQAGGNRAGVTDRAAGLTKSLDCGIRNLVGDRGAASGFAVRMLRREAAA